LGADDEKEAIQEEVMKMKMRLNIFKDVETTLAEIVEINKDRIEKKINESNENIINDYTLIYFFKGQPVYIDFLKSEESKKKNNSLDDNKNYMDILKKDLTSSKCRFILFICS
jgi:hypothetical protein